MLHLEPGVVVVLRYLAILIRIEPALGVTENLLTRQQLCLGLVVQLPVGVVHERSDRPTPRPARVDRNRVNASLGSIDRYRSRFLRLRPRRHYYHSHH